MLAIFAAIFVFRLMCKSERSYECSDILVHALKYIRPSVTCSLVHIYRKMKIAAKVASVNEPLYANLRNESSFSVHFLLLIDVNERKDTKALKCKCLYSNISDLPTHSHLSKENNLGSENGA